MPYNDIEIGEDGLARCGWVGTDQLYQNYHDEEWGVILRGDQQLFEKLSLEAFQAGLSWITILRRREAFRKAFNNFSIQKVANYTDNDVDKLLQDEGIIRNRLKIEATISNAQVISRFEPGTLTELMWSFAPQKTKVNYKKLQDVPAQTEESVALSKELKRRGLRFVGPTTMYALMQSTGMVNDHLADCHKAIR